MISGSGSGASHRGMLLIRSCSLKWNVEFRAIRLSNKVVADSERDTAFRNASLAHFMQSFGNLERPVSDVLDVYCHQCAIAMSCEQLARSALFLANNGIDPLTNERIVDEERARRLNSMMMLCGHYDASEWQFACGYRCIRSSG